MTGWTLPERLRNDVRSPDPATRVTAVEELDDFLDQVVFSLRALDGHLP